MGIFIVESTGPNRYVWGPYADEAKARRAAGDRHVVVESDSLTNGQVIKEDELSILQRIGSVTTVDTGVSLA